MPCLDRNEAIIMVVAIPQAMLIRAKIKNKVLIAPLPDLGDTKKYRLGIYV